ncbi:ROK family protein [Calidifontibacter indicus]|uniref:ROK family protein n=1 Tax=Calidifontibacter indicus TaxID=419650 RepID=UPI003D74BD7E
MNVLHGIVPPLLTPMLQDGAVDHDSLDRLIDHLLDAGVHGIFPLGSSGQVAYLTDAERDDVVRRTVERLGTGVGGCVVVDGRPLTGRHHVAGGIAHIPAVGADGLRCPCGRDAHLEATAAGPAIHRRFVALGGVADDTRAVVALAVSGDPLASRVVREAAVSLGRTIAGIVTAGGVAGAPSALGASVDSSVASPVDSPFDLSAARPQEERS